MWCRIENADAAHTVRAVQSVNADAVEVVVVLRFKLLCGCDRELQTPHRADVVQLSMEFAKYAKMACATQKKSWASVA